MMRSGAMNKSDSITELAKAMSLAQGSMGAAHKGANNPFFKSKYANLGSVIEAVKEPFSSNGLSYVQFPIEDGGRVGVETILMHESGEWISNKFTVQLSKQDAQGAGSAITYCRRYGLQAVAGIPSEDDDGNAASPQAKSNNQAPSNAQGNQQQDKPWLNDIDDGLTAWIIGEIAKGFTHDQCIAVLRNDWAISKNTADKIKQVN